MRRAISLIALVGVAGLGCKKPVPTTFVRATSEYAVSRGFHDTTTQHAIFLFGLSPYDTPQVSINGYPMHIYSAWIDGYLVQDSLPKINEGEELNLNVLLKDLNGTDREASAEVEVPPLPDLGIVALDSIFLRITWSPPDPEKVAFVLVDAQISCRDTSWNTGFGTYDTLIEEVKDNNSVSVLIPRVCSPYPSPISHTHAYVSVSFASGPWSGEKDNVKGVRGQYFALATVSDTVSWNRDTTYHFTYEAPKRDPHRLQELLNKYFAPPDPLRTQLW